MIKECKRREGNGGLSTIQRGTRGIISKDYLTRHSIFCESEDTVPKKTSEMIKSFIAYSVLFRVWEGDAW